MADRIISFRPDTAANWASNNPILSSGEGAVETDTGKAKIGDGSTVYSSLGYITDVISIIDTVYPVGVQYIQYASVANNTATVALPDAEGPTALFGGTWVKLWDTEGIDFHTEGYDGAGRTNGLMEDQGQGHKHGMLTKSNTLAGTNPVPMSGNNPTADQTGTTETPTTDGVNGTPRTGTRTSDKNRLMRIWKRTA